MTYVPDMTQRFPDAGEPVAENEYYVSIELPMTVELRVPGVDQEEAEEEAKRQMKQSDFKQLITDYDISKMEVVNVEQI